MMQRMRRFLSHTSDQAEFDMASQFADSTAARIDETLTRAPAGAIHEQLVGDMAFAEGVRDALAWATGLNAASDRLTRLLDLQTGARHRDHGVNCPAAYGTGSCTCGRTR